MFHVEFKKWASVLIIGSLTLVAAPSYAAERVTPAEAGLSAEKLESLKAFVNGYVNSGRIVGGTTLVARGDKIGHFETYGQINKENGTAMSEDAVFRIYSMTKPITGVAMMMLWEEGKYDLDDPVSKYLPSFKDQRVFTGANEDGSLQTEPVKREATIRDLMRHTAGLTYGVFGNTPVDKAYIDAGIFNPQLTLAEQIEKLGKVPLLYQPGEAWVYSLSVDVQGALVEVLSGQSLDTFFEERIFKPLGMNDTGFVVREDQKDRFVELYGFDENKKLVPYRGPFYTDYTQKPNSLSGGGGLVSTTLDYLTFARMITNDGELNGVRLLKKETLDLMRRDQLPEALEGIAGGTQGLGFGLNFAVVKDPAKVPGRTEVGEYFWGGMANTVFWIDPTNDVIAIFMTNMLPPSVFPFRKELRNYIYNAVE